MKNIFFTESQLNLISKKLITEAVGVPEGILDEAEKLYNFISEQLKRIDTKESNYEFGSTFEINILDLKLKEVEVEVSVETVDEYDGKMVIGSMGVYSHSRFEPGIKMVIVLQNSELHLSINFIASENWEPSDIYKSFTEDSIETISILAHELKHRYDKSKRKIGQLGKSVKYQVYASSGIRFGIPVLDDFMRKSYFINSIENLVRPTEIASRMKLKGITREQFYDFIINDPTFVEIKSIRDFTFEELIGGLKNDLDKINRLLNHIGLDHEKMSDNEKISKVLELVYINIVNAKVNIFDDHFYNAKDKLDQLFSQIMGSSVVNKEKEKIRNKYLSRIIRYQNDPVKFFRDECNNFNKLGNQMIKKISKIYSLIPDEKQETNESIINWDLHQKLMEKKYGKRPIQTSYNFKK
jgi:hypothetical protein